MRQRRLADRIRHVSLSAVGNLAAREGTWLPSLSPASARFRRTGYHGYSHSNPRSHFSRLVIVRSVNFQFMQYAWQKALECLMKASPTRQRSITAFLTVVMAFLINMMGTEFRGELSLT